MKTGKIYKIISSQGNECYIGSTTNTIRDRFRKHKNAYKRYQKINIGKICLYDMFDKYGFQSCKIILIKEYQIVDKKHLEAYEQLWISKLKSINKNNPFHIKWLYHKDYRNQNRDKMRLYYEENKDKLNDYQRSYYYANTDRIANYQKDYYNNNKTKILNYYKDYYANNKEKLKQYAKEYYQKNKKA
jgi:hypothetical protein